MSATARLGENTVLLHFAVKLLEGKLKGVTGINSDLTHRLPARSTITRSSSILSLVAIAAINRLVPPWLEGHLGLIATARTRCSIHLAWFAGTAIPALTFACSATRWTAAWSVCQPVTLVKFLFACCKYKFLVAVSTNQGLITQCHVSFSIPGTKSQQTIVYCALCQQTVIYQRNSARYNARRVYHIQYPKSLICGPNCTFWPRPRPPTRGGLLKRTGRQRLSSVMPLLSSFNLSNSIFIRLKIRIDVHFALSYRYLLHIKDWTGRSQRSILHQFVV